MAYNAGKPAGDDTIAASDTLISGNFAQIVANLSNSHGWSDDTATDCTHTFLHGLITRLMTGSSGSVDENLSYIPTGVEFVFVLVNGAATEVCIGSGYHDGTNDGCVGVYAETATPTAWSVIQSATACIYVPDGFGVSQSATCTLGTNKFTLVWTKAGSPTGTMYIKYLAHG